MRAISVILAILLILLSASPALGAPPACTKAIPLKYKERVPCVQGVLIPPEWAIQAIQCRDVDLPRCRNNAELVRTTTEADIKALTDKLTATLEFSDKQGLLLEDALKPDPWWKNPVLWAAVGFAAGVGVTVTVVQAVNR